MSGGRKWSWGKYKKLKWMKSSLRWHNPCQIPAMLRVKLLKSLLEELKSTIAECTRQILVSQCRKSSLKTTIVEWFTRTQNIFASDVIFIFVTAASALTAWTMMSSGLGTQLLPVSQSTTNLLSVNIFISIQMSELNIFATVKINYCSYIGTNHEKRLFAALDIEICQK